MPALAYRTTIPKPDDPAILKAVYTARQRGHPQETAAQFACISQRTFEDWYRIGKEQLASAGDVRMTEASARELGPHALFAWTIKEADWEMVDDNLKHIHAARAENWQAAMTLLERRRPDDFGRNQRITTESVNINVSVTAELTEAQTTELLAALAERSGQARTLPSIDNPHVPNNLLPEATEQT